MMVRIAAMLDRLNSICVSREEADRQDHVVDQRRDRADGELPFEAEPDVDHDAGDGDQHRERAGPGEFARDARPDHLDAPVLVVRRAERRAHLLDHRLLRVLAARLRGDADQHVASLAEPLDLHFAEAERRSTLRRGSPPSRRSAVGLGPR